MFEQNQRDADPVFIKKLIEEISINQKRTIGLSRKDWKEAATQATVDWRQIGI